MEKVLIVGKGLGTSEASRIMFELLKRGIVTEIMATAENLAKHAHDLNDAFVKLAAIQKDFIKSSRPILISSCNPYERHYRHNKNRNFKIT